MLKSNEDLFYTGQILTELLKEFSDDEAEHIFSIIKRCKANQPICGWRWNTTFEKHGFVSGCGYYLAELYRDHSYKYCPHCGKEIKTV